MHEEDVLEEIENGSDAESILLERMPSAKRKFNKLCKNINEFLSEVQKEFPDAQYYTASGGFNLMLCGPHSNCTGEAQRQLLALSGQGVSIGDGDF